MGRVVATKRAGGRPAGRWLDESDPLTLLLWRQSDVITRQQALRALSPAAVKHRLATGRWQRLHTGVYVAHDGPVTRQQLLWVAHLALAPNAYLAGLTAAEACGLRGHRTDQIHVLIAANRHDQTPPPGTRVHRSRRLRRTEVNLLGAPPHTTAARSIVDAAQWAATDEAAHTVIAAGFQQRLVTADEIHSVLHRLARVSRRALILDAVADAAGGAHSLPEALFVRHLRRAGLPVPALQLRRRDAGGNVRYLDGYYERWRIHIEIDGSQHLEVGSYWRDMHRQNQLWIAGDRVLRFPAWAIRHRPEDVLAQIRAALHAAGWRPT